MDIKTAQETFEAMEAYNGDFMDAAKESAKFTTGGFGEGQWDENAMRELEAQNRPTTQINIILPKVNMATGLERQQRTYWKAVPFGYNDEDWPKLINPLLMHLDHVNNLHRKFSRVYKDGVITGRGWVDVYVEEDENFGKEVIIEREGWANVHIDPDAKTDDISKWGRLAREKWLTRKQLKSYFPDAAEGLIRATKSNPSKEYGDKYKYGTRWSMYYRADKFRVVDMWERTWSDVFFIVDLMNGIKLPFKYKTKSSARTALNEIASQQNRPADDFGIVGKKVSSVTESTFCGNTELVEEHPLKYDHGEFPLVPYFYYFEDVGEGVETFGMVENLKDPQREKNKRRAQSLDVINRTPKGGGIIDKHSGITEDDLNKASRAGTWIKVDLRKKSVRDMMQQWGLGHLQILNYMGLLEERSEIDAKEISGATDPLMGVASGSKESGFAASTRIKQGLLTLEEPINNLDETKKRVMRMAISNMQQYYSREKIKRIIGFNSDANEEDIEKFISAFKENAGLLKYDIILDKSDSPTMRAMKFKEIAELIQRIPQYAPALLPELIKQSDYASKDEILEGIQKVQLAEMMKE